MSTKVATTTATPVGLVYNGGDAITPVSCSGPGTAWTPAYGDDVWTSCMYIYGHAGSYPAQLGIRWSVTYTSNAGASGSLGTHTTWASAPVIVEEIQALVTS